MDDTVASSLPPDIAEALRKELDPGEDVRWCGQPDPGVVFRRQVPTAALMGVLLLGFVTLCFALGYSTLQELRGIEPLLGRSERPPGYGQVYFAFGLGLFVALWILPATATPWAKESAARRTIYAVTRTRVLKVVVSGRGVPTVTAVEPSHPLHLRREGLDTNKGDILLYPRSADKTSSMLTLEAINDARTVERLIRQCFDP